MKNLFQCKIVRSSSLLHNCLVGHISVFATSSLFMFFKLIISLVNAKDLWESY
jgi:hypothetical protein